MSRRQTRYINGIIEENECLKPIENDMRNGFEMLCECFCNGGKALICGNGGSAADAGHITGELVKSFLLNRPIPDNDAKSLPVGIAGLLQRGLPAISLVSQVPLITAIANDISYDMIFAQQVYVYGKKGDVLIAISTSGNAQNVVNAAIVAKATGVNVLALTGGAGGTLSGYADSIICAPFDKTEKIQEMHVKLYHAICADLEEYFFGLNSLANN